MEEIWKLVPAAREPAGILRAPKWSEWPKWYSECWGSLSIKCGRERAGRTVQTAIFLRAAPGAPTARCTVHCARYTVCTRYTVALYTVALYTDTSELIFPFISHHFHDHLIPLN